MRKPLMRKPLIFRCFHWYRKGILETAKNKLKTANCPENAVESLIAFFSPINVIKNLLDKETFLKLICSDKYTVLQIQFH